jgi:hypothetical protein
MPNKKQAKKKTKPKKAVKKAVKKAGKTATGKKTPSAPINWLRDWGPFDFGGLTDAEITRRRGNVETIVDNFLAAQNAASRPENRHAIIHRGWIRQVDDHWHIVFLNPPVRPARPGGPGSVDPPAPSQPPPPPIA